MRRNCNLELRLLPSSFPLSDPHGHNMVEESNESPENHHQRPQQPLTIFYNGRICVCDVTELQARAILTMASREMDETIKTPTTRSGSGSEPASPTLQSQIYSPSSALSMKRSLQRFLQKRKNRIQATSPYH